MSRRIAWVTHHLIKEEERSDALLPGLYAGGAELNDAVMRSHQPAGYDVDVIGPDDWAQAMDYERVVITGTDRLSEEAMVQLATKSPLVWIQHAQQPAAARKHLFEKAAPFITMSRLHQAHEARWSRVSDEFVHSPVWDVNEVQPAAKEPFALFAARNHPAKGKINARIKADQLGIPLVELSNVDRSIVLEHMTRAQWFIHLPKEFDACPRTVIEATLAGCEVITNANLVGRLEPGDPREILTQQPPKFWSLV
jgi:hypothetical protein